MTVSTTDNRIPYSGNGVTTAFDFPYKFLSTGDLKVYVDDVLMTLTTDYSVGAPSDDGALVTFVVAPAVGTNNIVILRDPDLLQQSALPSNGPFPSTTVETMVDKLTLQVQRLKELLTRSFRLADSDTSGADTTLPTPVSNNVIGWNEEADALQNFTPETFATIVAFGTANSDVFSGDGVTTLFPLTANPGALNNLDISIGGVTQTPGIDYGWSSGTALSFTSAPPAGTDNILVRYMQGLSIADAESAPWSQTGSGVIQRTIGTKLRDIVSVKDFGAVGDGVTDDTASINSAFAVSSGAYFPDGTYLYTGDIDTLLARNLQGAGLIRFSGYNYPTTRKQALNALWAGEAQVWSMGHALAVETTQRRHIPVGASVARIGLVTGVTVSHVNGTYLADAIRIQRDSANASTAAANLVLNLSREETKLLQGKSCVLQFNGLESSTYSGGTLAYRVQYSLEQEQAIIADTGEYTSGNTNLVSSSVQLGTTARPERAPFWVTFDVPDNAIQVSVVFSVDFTGVAGASDYIELEGISLHDGTQPAEILRESFSDLLNKAASRYQTSYPYGAPRGTNTEQGAVQAIAFDTGATFSFVMDVRFSPLMTMPPQLIFQSPTSGVESRILDKDTAANINGLAYNLSNSGVTITNNAVTVAGDRYLCHYTALVTL